jgi:hypothetical protein
MCAPLVSLLSGSLGLELIPSLLDLFVFVSALRADRWGDLQIFSGTVLMKLSRQLVVLFLKRIDLGLMALASTQSKN